MPLLRRRKLPGPKRILLFVAGDFFHKHSSTACAFAQRRAVLKSKPQRTQGAQRRNFIATRFRCVSADAGNGSMKRQKVSVFAVSLDELGIILC